MVEGEIKRQPSKVYRDEIYSLQILLSRTQAGLGRTVKQEQEEISPNRVQRFNLISVVLFLNPNEEYSFQLFVVVLNVCSV